jgi:hypothetical protein
MSRSLARDATVTDTALNQLEKLLDVVKSAGKAVGGVRVR